MIFKVTICKGAFVHLKNTGGLKKMDQISKYYDFKFSPSFWKCLCSALFSTCTPSAITQKSNIKTPGGHSEIHSRAHSWTKGDQFPKTHRVIPRHHWSNGYLFKFNCFYLACCQSESSYLWQAYAELPKVLCIYAIVLISFCRKIVGCFSKIIFVKNCNRLYRLQQNHGLIADLLLLISDMEHTWNICLL